MPLQFGAIKNNQRHITREQDTQGILLAQPAELKREAYRNGYVVSSTVEEAVTSLEIQ